MICSRLAPSSVPSSTSQVLALPSAAFPVETMKNARSDSRVVKCAWVILAGMSRVLRAARKAKRSFVSHDVIRGGGKTSAPVDRAIHSSWNYHAGGRARGSFIREICSEISQRWILPRIAFLVLPSSEIYGGLFVPADKFRTSNYEKLPLRVRSRCKRKILSVIIKTDCAIAYYELS